MAVTTITTTEPTHRLSQWGRELDQGITLDSTDADSGSTPTTRFRSGNVVALRTSTGRYVEVNDTNADVPTQGTMTGTAAFTSGGTTFKWRYRHGEEHTITNTTGTGTVDNWVTDLNADALFSADLIASAVATFLVIEARRAGSHEYWQVTDGTVNAAVVVANNTYFRGTDPDVRITEKTVDLADDNGTARHHGVASSYLGDYDESELIVGGTKGATIPPWARDVLIGRGSRMR